MLTDYQFAFKGKDLPPPGAFMYQYVVGDQGVFIRAHRSWLDVSFLIAPAMGLLRGLANIGGYFQLDELVPLGYTNAIFRNAFQHKDSERLYWGVYDPKGWNFVIPEQDATKGSVRPRNPFSRVGRASLIELHSHNSMEAHFSPADDGDETGFKIYTVVGKVDSSRPEILTRVGIYGHFWTIRSNWVYQLPAYVRDAAYQLEIDREVEWT